MSGPEWYLVLGVALIVAGAVRLLLSTDLVRQVLALNVAGLGTLLVLVSISALERSGGGDLTGGVAAGSGTDPVLQALVLTGIVITVSVTGLALALVRRIERDEQDDAQDDARDDVRPADPGRETR